MTDSVGRMPSTTWEFALSAADELTVWALVGAPSGDPARTAPRAQVVVVLAAVLHSVASGAGLHSEQVREVPLADPDPASRSAASELRDYALSALEAAPAPAGLGAEEREQLLREGGDVLVTAASAAGAVLDRHAAGTHGRVTLADRAGVMAADRRGRLLRGARDVFGDESD